MININIKYTTYDNYPGEIRSRKKGNTLTITVVTPQNWGMFSEDGNQALLENAIKAVERLSKLAHILKAPPSPQDSRSLRRKFLSYYNTILFMYYSGYHHLREFTYGRCILGETNTNDFGELSDTAVRDTVAGFGDILIEAIMAIPLTETEREDLTDWSSYYDLPSF